MGKAPTHNSCTSVHVHLSNVSSSQHSSANWEGLRGFAAWMHTSTTDLAESLIQSVSVSGLGKGEEKNSKEKRKERKSASRHSQTASQLRDGDWSFKIIKSIYLPNLCLNKATHQWRHANGGEEELSSIPSFVVRQTTSFWRHAGPNCDDKKEDDNSRSTWVKSTISALPALLVASFFMTLGDLTSPTRTNNRSY